MPNEVMMEVMRFFRSEGARARMQEIGGKARGEGDGVLLGDANVEGAFREPLAEQVKTAALALDRQEADLLKTLAAEVGATEILFDQSLSPAQQRNLERHLAGMVCRKLQRHDLERALHRAEIRQDKLPVADRPGKEQRADRRVRTRILEDARARHHRPLDPATAEQFAPPPGALGIGHVDRRRQQVWLHTAGRGADRQRAFEVLPHGTPHGKESHEA